MVNVKLIVILLVIIAFCTAGYFLIVTFQNSENASKYPPTPFVKVSPTSSISSVSTNGQMTPCSSDQLTGTAEAQGGAGNIYVSLELTNTGKTSCTIKLGNTITETINATNITIHYQQNASNQSFVLAPSAKAYSQVHYPNGPQCQSPITEKPITLLYKNDSTSVVFEPNSQTSKLIVQTCSSPNENTTIDIWPLSKTPITP